MAVILAISAGAAAPAFAQEPAFTTVCAIIREPQAFAGKIVTLRATFDSGMEWVVLREPDESCKGGLWFENAPAKADGSTGVHDDRDKLFQSRSPVVLKKDADYEAFIKAVNAELYSRDEHVDCMYCKLNTVTATFTGRVDYSGEKEMGFGHLNGWDLRFVMASVCDVSAVEVEYDKALWSNTPIRFPHGTLKGRVTDSEGHGAAYSSVEAVPSEGDLPWANPNSGITNDDGSFSFHVKPGRYQIVVNRYRTATSPVPFEPRYFPSEERREKAQIVSVNDRQTVEDINIRIVTMPLK